MARAQLANLTNDSSDSDIEGGLGMKTARTARRPPLRKADPAAVTNRASNAPAAAAAGRKRKASQSPPPAQAQRQMGDLYKRQNRGRPRKSVSPKPPPGSSGPLDTPARRAATPTATPSKATRREVVTPRPAAAALKTAGAVVVAAPPAAPAEPTMPKPRSAAPYSKWRDEETDEAVKVFDEYKTANEDRHRATMAYIATLEDRLSSSRKPPAAMAPQPTESTELRELRDLTDSLRARVAELEAALEQGTSKRRPSDAASQLELYKLLSGTRILHSKAKPGQVTHRCEKAGRRGKMQFELTIPNDLQSGGKSTILYVPCLEKGTDADVRQSLPSYLLEEIEFNSDQASLFEWRLMSSLQRDDSDDEDEDDEEDYE